MTDLICEMHSPKADAAMREIEKKFSAQQVVMAILTVMDSERPKAPPNELRRRAYRILAEHNPETVTIEYGDGSGFRLTGLGLKDDPDGRVVIRTDSFRE